MKFLEMKDANGNVKEIRWIFCENMHSTYVETTDGIPVLPKKVKWDSLTMLLCASIGYDGSTIEFNKGCFEVKIHGENDIFTGFYANSVEDACEKLYKYCGLTMEEI